MELLAVASVLFCNPINDYSFRWKISGASSTEVENMIGNTLRLPPGFLHSGELIEVIVTVVNNESLTMSSVSRINYNLFYFKLKNSLKLSKASLSFQKKFATQV
jgi:hypothetical protein